MSSRWLTILVFICSTSAYSETETFDLIEYWGEPSYIKPIFDSRMIQISKSKKTFGLTMLANRDFLLLSRQQVEFLLPEQKIETASLISREIRATLAHSEKLERTLTNPFFANNKDIKENIAIQRRHAEYLSSINNKIKPYLVKAQLCSNSEAGFITTINLQTGVLGITQACLSHRKIKSWTEPVIIYAEKSIQKVQASIVVDE